MASTKRTKKEGLDHFAKEFSLPNGTKISSRFYNCIFLKTPPHEAENVASQANEFIKKNRLSINATALKFGTRDFVDIK